ncbi:MAG: 3-hydroxyacyl-CoA dehydrogenase NAD-binding domain-containing protein, partial [Pseudomonas sp.]
DFENVDIFIEAVAEDIGTKRLVFAELSKVSGADTMLASNTSSLSVTHLASLTKYPENVIGLHFFNPATVMKLAEVITGLTTSRATVDRALDFARQLGKDPVLVNEAPGFIVNRMLIPMINEAIGILAEDVATAEEIDKAMRLGANHPIGPLALADLIGNDVNLSIMETLHNETGDPKYRAHPLLRKMVRGNLLGRKTGRGFFSY